MFLFFNAPAAIPRLTRIFAAGLLAVSATGTASADSRIIHGPPGSISFGASVTILPNGNLVVTDPGHTAPGSGKRVGAVHLYNGTTLEAISMLTGSADGDAIGGDGVTVLSNGNYLVRSDQWGGRSGAITWGSATEGVSGVVSPDNSLVETGLAGSHVWETIALLGNGNYLVRNANWNGGRGAVTWGDGSRGVTGRVSAANSLVGTEDGYTAGTGGFQRLGNGNYVVFSSYYGADSHYGAVTWGSGSAGVRGEVSAANSLVDVWLAVTVMESGNYLVSTSDWNERRGAVTWGDGNAGVKGRVSAENSLIGTSPSDYVGQNGVRMLSDGNYLVISPFWNGSRGAVTWCDGASGGKGEVTPANSLVSTPPGKELSSLPEITPLEHGDYIVNNRDWNDRRGAITLGKGGAGISGEISAANSLVGVTPEDMSGSYIQPLDNGNFLLVSPNVDGKRGAVTHLRVDGPVKGEFSTANSFIGSMPGDRIGGNGVIVLGNGRFVVRSLDWNGGRGAVTWFGSAAAVTGVASPSNSLTGTLAGDKVGNGWIMPLDNGNCLVWTPEWNRGRGAVTWINGNAGVRGEVSAANSLIGSTVEDKIGNGGIAPLGNGNFVVRSPEWNGIRGAVTWMHGGAGVRGEVSADNSLIGSTVMDYVGGSEGGVEGSGVKVLPNGDYIVHSLGWNGRRGAVTWGSGTAGVMGAVSSTNSLTGSRPGDEAGIRGIFMLANGNYLVGSPVWNGNRGAVTWFGSKGMTGKISAVNSLIGTEVEDEVGGSGVTILNNGNYVICSPRWNGGRGAATWGSANTPVTGTVSIANSLIGSAEGDKVGWPVTVLKNGNYIVRSSYWSNSRGAVTWGSGISGVRGEVSSANSLTGTGDVEGYWISNVLVLSNGNYVVGNAAWNENRGSVTWGNGSSGVTGEVSTANSLTGVLPGDMIGYLSFGKSGIKELSDGNYLVGSRAWSHDLGAITVGDGQLGTRGHPGAGNSLTGTGVNTGWDITAVGDMTAQEDAARHRLIIGSPSANLVRVMPFIRSLTVTGGEGRDVFDGTVPARQRFTDFGPAGVGGEGVTRTFSLMDTEALSTALTGDPKVTVSGPHAGEFTVTRMPSLLSGDSALPTFDVTFTPAARGPRTALIRIPNNSIDRNPLEFTIQGLGETVPMARWLIASFGDVSEKTAPAEDFDGDGVANILEFAFGTDPAAATSGMAPLGYSGPLTGGGSFSHHGGPAVFADNGNYYGLWVRRNDAGDTGLSYIPQFSTDLKVWSPGTAEPRVLAEDGAFEVVGVPYPSRVPSETGDRFFRLAVTWQP